jgi:AcrR family transcriptional regulator
LEKRWDFSLREVARRAGVSHNAPYFHFADKCGLLGAIATSGYETLKGRTLAASKDLSKADEALDAIGIAYLHFGTENPAHYRLMFGPALQVLKDVMRRGIEDGSFKITQNVRWLLQGPCLQPGRVN